MARTGRPPKPKDELLAVTFRVMLTTEQRELIGRVAVHTGEDASSWARRILIEAARRAESGSAKRRKPG